MNRDLKYLHAPLPEDIEKFKLAGKFDDACEIIDSRLAKPLPLALRKRLELEKEIIRRIPEKYPHSFDAAVLIMQEIVRDFSPGEMRELWRGDAADWYFIDGEPRFADNFADNIIKTRPAYAKRLKTPDAPANLADLALRAEARAKLKQRGSLKYKLRARSEITIAPGAAKIGEIIKVHIPIPVEYAQVEGFKLISASSPKLISPPDYPQRTAYFEEPLCDGQKFFAEYEFVNSVKYFDPGPNEVYASQPAFYTEELPPHVVFTPYLRKLSREITGGEQNPLLKARRIYDFITTNVTYSFVRPYFTFANIPEYAASSLKGDCGFQALLFITLCRLAKIPAGWQSGAYASPEFVGSHDWARFYIAPFGWMFADCSFGGSAYRDGDDERREFYFGNLDPYRIPFASEFQADFYPPKKFRRIDPYDNQTGEAEYAGRGLNIGEFESKLELISIEEIF